MSDPKFVPRWYHQTINVPANSSIEGSPVVFSNTEVWPLHLLWMSMVGTPVLSATGPFAAAMGGVFNRIMMRIGTSQWGDLNLMPVVASALMAHRHNPLTLYANTTYASRYKFTVPYVLGPDDGMVCEVQNLGAAEHQRFSVIFNGYHLQDDGRRIPAQLAGRYYQNLGPGAPVTLDSSDLYNDGQYDLHLVEMLIDAVVPTSNHFGMKSAWRINPSTGIPWMPAANPITEGCIAPFNRPGIAVDDDGPRAYEFPAKTVMMRRQRTNILLFNLSDVDQEVELCLHGMLEVR